MKQYIFPPLSFTLSEQFTLDDCSFVSEGEAVIFSPATVQTWLCEPCVVEFLEAIAHERSLAEATSAWSHLSTDAQLDTLKQLVQIGILEQD